MSYITRSLEKVVQQVTQEYPVVLVTGPRQVGKTTMLQKLMEGTPRGYVSLDDLNERALAKNDPELFLQLHKPPVLIDEVQYAPELFTYIKVYADTHHEPGAFWLTGSQVFKLMHGVQESLAGRVAVLSMTSLSQSEINGADTEPFRVDLDALLKREEKAVPADTKDIFERIYRGSMPAIASGKNTNSQIFYSSYLSTYIERDVKELSDAIDALKFLRFMTAVAARCSHGAMNGAILENYVVSEIAKTYLNTGREPFLYYYRDKDAKEIDIVLEQDGVLNPIEIKKTSNPGTELTKVFSLLDKASVPRGKGAIVCMKPKVGIIDRDNYIVPIWII